MKPSEIYDEFLQLDEHDKLALCRMIFPDIEFTEIVSLANGQQVEAWLEEQAEVYGYVYVGDEQDAFM